MFTEQEKKKAKRTVMESIIFENIYKSSQVMEESIEKAEEAVAEIKEDLASGDKEVITFIDMLCNCMQEYHDTITKEKT